MKVLLDANLPHAIRRQLPGENMFVARFMGGDAIDNGELLAAAVDLGFDVVVTADRGFQDQ